MDHIPLAHYRFQNKTSANANNGSTGDDQPQLMRANRVYVIKCKPKVSFTVGGDRIYLSLSPSLPLSLSLSLSLPLSLSLNVNAPYPNF